MDIAKRNTSVVIIAIYFENIAVMSENISISHVATPYTNQNRMPYDISL